MAGRDAVEGIRRFEIDRRSTAFGLITSAVFHLFVISSYLFVEPNILHDQTEYQVPGSTTVFWEPLNTPVPPAGAGRFSQRPSEAGIPIAVPDFKKILENIVDPILTQSDDSFLPSSDSLMDGNPGGEGNGEAEAGHGSPDGTVNLEDDPPIFTSYEVRLPIIITKVTPDYPEMARRTGIEGKVYMLMLVSKNGKVVKAKVAKSDNEVFDSNTIEAASKWIFTPAMTNARPVAVWVTVPFEFKLNK